MLPLEYRRAVCRDDVALLATAGQSGRNPDLPHQVALQLKVTVLLPFELTTTVESIAGEP
jgi:hypothetical protein